MSIDKTNLLATGHTAEQLLTTVGKILGDTHISSKKSLDKAPGSLQKEAVFANLLHELPAPIGQGLTIAALIARQNPAIRIYVAPACQEKKLLGIKKKATVYCQSQIQAVQLQDFRPDLEIIVSSSSLNNILEQEKVQAFLATETSLQLNGLLGQNTHKIADWSYYEFNPVEFIPAAGQDAIALVAATTDKPSRRKLRPFHQEEISRKTNIERQILALCPEKASSLAAYCQVDGNGYYQLHAMLDLGGKPKYAKASASSHLGLAEKVLAVLV